VSNEEFMPRLHKALLAQNIPTPALTQAMYDYNRYPESERQRIIDSEELKASEYEG
jgi:hypothetical protein